jgi:predicted metal-dependent phosphotriesterase family hydrolase
MTTEALQNIDIAVRLADRELIDRAMRRAARAAAIRHKREAVPLVVHQDGRVVEIPPEQIIIPPEE